MTSWKLYWITRLDAIGILLTITYAMIIAVIVVMSILWLFTFLDDGYDLKKINKILLKLMIAFAINSLGFLIPTTKEMAFIIVAPKVYTAVKENKELNQIPSKVVGLANLWLDNLYMKQLEPKEK